MAKGKPRTRQAIRQEGRTMVEKVSKIPPTDQGPTKVGNLLSEDARTTSVERRRSRNPVRKRWTQTVMPWIDEWWLDAVCEEDDEKAD